MSTIVSAVVCTVKFIDFISFDRWQHLFEADLNFVCCPCYNLTQNIISQYVDGTD